MAFSYNRNTRVLRFSLEQAHMIEGIGVMAKLRINETLEMRSTPSSI